MRHFVHIGYHGARYSGWQKHAGVTSVQQVIENALIRILKSPVAIVGCGRTDAHVHASQFFFHMDIAPNPDFDLKFRLNKTLPDDIAVFDIIEMQGLPHARFDAVQRNYDYFIHTRKDPFLSGFSSYYDEKKLDIDSMKAAAALLPLYNDYKAFCKSPDKNEHTICHVSSAGLLINPNSGRLRFHISANRYLGKMIRVIVERLIRIGTGKMSLDEFEGYLLNPQALQNITPAHPQGLYLSKIIYPYLDIATSDAFTALLAAEAGDEWL